MRLKVPNLPEKKVTLCAAANKKSIVSALKKLGIETVSPHPCESIDNEVACHADMLLCQVDRNTVFTEPSQTSLSKKLKDIGFNVFFSEMPEKKYPGDVRLNFAVGADFILGNFAVADKTLFEFFKKSGKKLINVKQGYAKCSLCFVSSDAFITEDDGIAKALIKEKKDVLLISKGDVYLSEKHYGFFGGASGKISERFLAVTGGIEHHRDAKAILDFTRRGANKANSRKNH